MNYSLKIIADHTYLRQAFKISGLLLFLLLCQYCAFSQGQAPGHYIGASISAADNTLRQGHLLGSGSVSDQSTSKFGLHYTFQKTKNLGIESGLQLLKHKYNMTPAFTGIAQESTVQEFQFISLPVNLKYSFFNYFYLNGGLIFDLEVKNTGAVNNQSGAGLGIGAGVQYFYKNRIGIFVNPQIAQHSLINFSDSNHPRKLAESSIAFGISYKL